MRRLSGTRPIPSRAIAWGVSRVRLWPSNSIVPRHGLRNPIVVFMSVVLPMPFLPRSATASPGRTSSDTPKRIGVAPYPAWTSVILSTVTDPLPRYPLVPAAPEVRLDHPRVVPDRLGRPLGDLLTEVEDRDPV